MRSTGWFAGAAVVVASVVATTLHAQRAARNPLDGLAQYVEQMRQDWKVPGLALAIVKDDSVIFAHGFGVRELGKPDSVDQHTLFAIASCSKAFTATLVGMLTSEGKLAWDDHAADRMPGFQLFDPYVTREFTLAIEDGNPVLRQGPSFVGDLDHWHFDTYRIIWRDRSLGRDFVTFRLDPHGEPSEAVFGLESETVYSKSGS
jgi:hypothetical protein